MEDTPHLTSHPQKEMALQEENIQLILTVPEFLQPT